MQAPLDLRKGEKEAMSVFHNQMEVFEYKYLV